ELLAQPELKRRFEHVPELKRKPFPEIHLAHPWIGEYLARGAASHQLSVVQDIGIAADSKCLPNIVIRYQYSNSALAQVPDDPLDVEHRDRIDARERLVEKDELRLGRERPRNLDPAPLAAREAHAQAVSHVTDV